MKQLIFTALFVCCTLTLAYGADDAKKSDKKPKPINTTCPLTDEKIDPTVTTQYKGKTIGFCCEDCIKKFDVDPAAYVANLK